MKGCILFIAVISFLSISCTENGSEIQGFGKTLHKYSGSLEPVLLENYPNEIDSTIKDFFHTKGINDKLKISVQHSLTFEENNQAYIDSSIYTVYVSFNNNKKKQVWRFDFNKSLKKLGEVQIK